jgi:hypothetical protein
MGLTVFEILSRLRELEKDALGGAKEAAKRGDYAAAHSFQIQANVLRETFVEFKFNHGK